MKQQDFIGFLFVLVMISAIACGVWLAAHGRSEQKTIKQRMESCDFPSYNQILECEKIKAIRECVIREKKK